MKGPDSESTSRQMPPSRPRTIAHHRLGFSLRIYIVSYAFGAKMHHSVAARTINRETVGTFTGFKNEEKLNISFIIVVDISTEVGLKNTHANVTAKNVAKRDQIRFLGTHFAFLKR